MKDSNQTTDQPRWLSTSMLVAAVLVFSALVVIWAAAFFVIDRLFLHRRDSSHFVISEPEKRPLERTRTVQSVPGRGLT